MSNTEFGDISFDLPKNQSNVIKVIGVGGGGSNAINHMFQLGIKGVDFVICNTDAQALENSTVPNKIQLGVSLTEGLGAGANPEIGEQAAVESFDEIKNMLDVNTKMVFITAGMGGGTGTGAAPVIAKQAKEMDILTVGIVTIPFQFEGRMRNEQAQRGVEKLRSHVDSLIVINNNKLREVYGNLGFKAGFSKADEVLATASRGIAEVITHHYTQNIDLRDAKTVLSNSGTAIMGSASASGANRAQDAIAKALDSPLLNDNKITGAQNVLLLIVSGSEEITIDEIGEINDHIQAEAGHSANIIMGVGEDEALEGAISVTIIATGFNVEQQDEITNTETKKIIHTLEDEQKAEHEFPSNRSHAGSFTELPLPEEKKEPEQPKKIVHTLDENLDEVEAPTPKSPQQVVQKQVQQEAKITEVKQVQPTPAKDPDLYTPPSAYNMDVFYDEVNPEDFVINDTNAEVDEVEVKDDENDEEQFMFTFDFPINQEEEKREQPKAEIPKPEVEQTPKQETVKRHVLNTEDAEEPSYEVKNIEVNEPVEVIPATENASNGTVKRYSLDDYMEFEQQLENSKPAKKQESEAPKDETIAFEKRTVQPTPKKQEEQDENPFNNPIPEHVVERAAERRAKMKEFNYKFRGNASQIEEIEKQPAYKRAGINLDSTNYGENKMSRTSLGQDENNDLQFRRNNSFLHDNVD
ncbi:MAG: cell division protein FtsZ [Zunongwangia sp.]|uniref:Cell division protein FtsZ n=3 Tax=Zunongwangia profunda TaxID=398743 RepID=D5BLI4_ZUNPS|nr:cell division protein FtsZ [Zunongwangia profunda]ADF54110.1 cell division protein FtsZ [Zunongwangia profunda SM-A87]MAO37108.1 cell division protein FtsZ [Zunongwangia sp.]|tara:strand:- start:515 stop:2599 length:2085 start_codon:yes stop_codon:yes gene_type:complete